MRRFNMKTSALRKKSIEELQKLADETRAKIIDKKKARQLSEESDHNDVSKLRKELARTLTIKSELERQNG